MNLLDRLRRLRAPNTIHRQLFPRPAVDVSGGLVGGEYPVMYYSHETPPPGVRKIADGFADWLNHHCVDDMEA